MCGSYSPLSCMYGRETAPTDEEALRFHFSSSPFRTAHLYSRKPDRCPADVYSLYTLANFLSIGHMKSGCRSELSQTVFVVRVPTGREGRCPAFLLLRGIYGRSQIASRQHDNNRGHILRTWRGGTASSSHSKRSRYTVLTVTRAV